MPSPSRPSSLFYRWALYAVRHKWSVVVGSAAALATAIVLAVTVGGAYQTRFEIPGSDSQKAADLLAERFPSQGGATAQIVFRADGSVTDAAVRTRIEAILTDARLLPGVSDVSSPYERPGAISDDRHTAFATLQYPDEEARGQGSALVDLVELSTGNGLIVEAGGPVVEYTEQGPPGATELVGIAAAAVILIIAFGSLVAMGLPIVTALFGVGGSIAVITALTSVLDMAEFTSTFASMIGLGVGIDYCLLVVTRFREQLHKGHSVEESVAISIDTAGRSVLFAGTVVVIGLLGLLLMGIPFVGSLGLAAALVVTLCAATALVLLPALLAIIGTRVDSLRVPFLHSTDVNADRSVWFRLSRSIQRRPVVFIIGAAAVLLVLAIPVLDINTNFTDAGNNRPETHSRRAYDLLTDAFGPGFNGPLLIVADLRAPGGEERLEDLTAALSQAENVESVSAPRMNPDGDTAIITVYPGTSPQDGATNKLVHMLRDSVIPPATEGRAMDVFVAGRTAASIDVADKINARLPLFFTMVIGLSFVVLMVVFRSIAVPLKAALMNLLSIGASYGAIVAIFQWGWFAGPLGIEQTGPIEVFLPMMMFAVVFGLSMDYEVFLVSRIREEYLKDGDNARAVSMGLSSTARVITSAALIMIAVFGSFMLGNERVIKEFGLGLSMAIFLDATIVRLLLVPALMEVLGKANWWMPSALERWLPNLHLEGPTEREAQAEYVGVGK